MSQAPVNQSPGRYSLRGLNTVLTVFVLSWFWPLDCQAQSQEKTSTDRLNRPNLIFLFSDDQAYDTIGVYGAPQAKTPNLDRLGQMGIIFDRHYNTTAICMASRANVMTGLLEYRNGCNFMHGPMSQKIWDQSYPVALRKAGYRTAFGGKFGFAVVEDPTQGGSDNHYDHLPLKDFDVWHGGIGQTSYVTKENKYLAEFAEDYPHSSRAYGAASQRFIQESTKTDQPFCLSIFFKAPHRPTTPDPIFDDVYRDTEFRKLPNYGREAGKHLALQSTMGRQYPRFVEWGYDHEESYQKALRTYHQQIYGVDYAVGMILEELEKQGVADNTVIIFSSDNGFFNGSHGFGSKVLPYEEGARVPLIIYDPRHPESGNGRRISQVTGNIDIPATLLDLAGVSGFEDMDGTSLKPILEGGPGSEIKRQYLPIIQVWGPMATQCLSVVTENHKYVYWFYGENMNPVEELFDMKLDPYELINQASDPCYKEALTQMRGYYEEERQRWGRLAVPYNHYQEFAQLMDRKIPWQEKRQLAQGPWKMSP